MTENEERLEELMDAICRLVSIAEDSICREGFEELDNAGAEIIGCLEELEQYRAIGTVYALQKSVKEEDVLKFYYIESEDKYVVGQRVDNFYYGEVGKTGLAFYMSRYLPWGEHVVAPDTLWKEHTYPSEPKEIPFFDWLQGFMKKEYKVSEMPTGWIPCSERLPRYEEDVLLYLSSYEIQMGYKVIETGGDCFYTYISQEFVDMEDVIAWQPLPTPYQPKGE